MTTVHDITDYVIQECHIYDKYHDQMTRIIKWSEDSVEPIGDFLAFSYPNEKRVIMKQHVFINNKELHNTVSRLWDRYSKETMVHDIEAHPMYNDHSYSVIDGIPARLLGFAIFIRKGDLE